jgi:hypothetical protein
VNRYDNLPILRHAKVVETFLEEDDDEDNEGDERVEDIYLSGRTCADLSF